MEEEYFWKLFDVRTLGRCLLFEIYFVLNKHWIIQKPDSIDSYTLSMHEIFPFDL